MSAYTSQTYTFAFDSVETPTIERLGGKCNSLAIMTSAGMPVPPGFAVTTDAFDKVMDETGLRTRIREILAKYDILFVADEVICGFGRTGEWFGSDYYGNKPDLMTIAKGLTSGYVPMGGLIVSDKVFQVINEGGDFNHGFTYSGHPVAAAVGLENLRILKEEKIIERVKNETAPYLQARLRELADHPLVGEVRGVGMLGAIELVKNKATRERYPSDKAAGMTCRGYCFSNGLIMRAVGDTMIIAPPLVITKQEIDELVEKARMCLDLAYRDLQG